MIMNKINKPIKYDYSVFFILLAQNGVVVIEPVVNELIKTDYRTVKVNPKNLKIKFTCI